LFIFQVFLLSNWGPLDSSTVCSNGSVTKSFENIFTDLVWPKHAKTIVEIFILPNYFVLSIKNTKNITVTRIFFKEYKKYNSYKDIFYSKKSESLT
jgi:hypothetical protein